MKKQGVSDIVDQEIRRLREEAAILDRQINDLAGQRNRLQMLISILEAHQSHQTPIPERPTEKVAASTARTRRDAAPTAHSRQDLRVGRPVRMLEGVYANLQGIIRWCKESPRGMICTLSLRSPTGRAVRTQVTERSLGQKWEMLDTPGKTEREPPALDTSGVVSRTRKPKKERRSSKGTTRGAGGPRRATRPVELLARNTPVQVLKGKYTGWKGFISGIRDKGTAITYALTLKGPANEDGRTQVNHGSLGDSWVLLDSPGVAREAPPPPPKVLRRRHAQTPMAGEDQKVAPETPVEAPGNAAAETLRNDLPERASSGREEGTSPVQTSASTSGESSIRYTPSSPVLPEKTRIRMLSGPHLGHTGVIVRVQPRPGPRTEAIYTILIDTGADGDTVITSARHSSLGRSWTVL